MVPVDGWLKLRFSELASLGSNRLSMVGGSNWGRINLGAI
jgi:hypothetical protein